MRILVAHNVGRDRNGGMSRIMGFVHDEIAARGHDVDWLCADDLPARWRTTASRLAFPWLVWRRACAARRAGRPYDVVNVHEPHGALIALRQDQLTTRGVVVTSHGIERRGWDLALEEHRLGRGGPSLRSRILYPATSLWQSRIALTRARLVLTLNDEDRVYVSTKFRVDPSRVARMRPGASAAFAAPAAARSYASGQRLLFAGTWRHNKGITDLVPAFCALARRHPALKLTVLGAGVHPEVVATAFPDDVRGRVTAISSSDDRLAIQTLALSDIFVLPSLFEGTPLTLIEAMVAGLPVVTTDTCGMRDVVRHQVSGLLVPTRSPQAIVAAVDQLLDSPLLRESLGRCAHEAASRFTWPTVATEVLAAYEQIRPPRES